MEKTIKVVPLNQLVPDAQQPRQDFDPGAMARLAESVSKQGILHPLIVEKMPNGKFLIIDGERRYRTATKLNLKEVPVVIYEKMDDRQRLITRFHLQEQHQSWSSFDKARALALLKDESGMKENELADLLGLSAKTVEGYLSLLALSRRSVTIMNEKKIPFTFQRNIARIVKRIPEAIKKEKVEKALVEKIERGVIVDSGQIGKYNLALRAGGDKILKAIIAQKDFTPDNALRLAGIATERKIAFLVNQFVWLGKQAQKLVNEKLDDELTDERVVRIRKAIELVQKLVDKVGYVEERPRRKVRVG